MQGKDWLRLDGYEVVNNEDFDDEEWMDVVISLSKEKFE